MATRYSSLNQAFHWVTALLMFAVIITGWVQINRELTPGVLTIFNWHKTFGLFILALTAVRLVWRKIEPPPPYPPNIAAWERRLARLTYGLFYVLLLWMPITGYMEALYAGWPPRIFDLFATPQWTRKDEDLSNVFDALHVWGQWGVYFLIVLHVAGVVFHLLRRDGMMGRMLPPQALNPLPEGQISEWNVWAVARTPTSVSHAESKRVQSTGVANPLGRQRDDAV